ncbi:MAG: HAMP domain-containing protein [Candidatus Omnitrophica bacterium]|nr:HAMP domain-containing protein [Candidatus Omnitrophota bacterium]
MKSITLQSRIIILFVIFTIFTIGIFVVIQLSHELNSVNQEIEYRARANSNEVEEEFREILLRFPDRAEAIEVMGEKLQALKTSGFLERAYVLDSSGEIVFSTEGWFGGQKGSFTDFNILQKFFAEDSRRREAVTDKKSRLLSVYIPLDQEDELRYLVRLFFPLGDIWTAMRQVYQPAFAVGLLFIVLNVLFGISLSRAIIGPIKVVSEAAKKIAAGNLDLRVRMSTNDELEELANTFNVMTVELDKMKRQAEDANPLTKLPGNVLIREEIEMRIQNKEKFAVVYCDLDNFKAFNDKYGIGKGDEAIKLTGEIFKRAVEHKGESDDFIGHEGGDDFLLVCRLSRVEEVANYIIEEFDVRIRDLYDKEDKAQGYIIATGRDGVKRQFSIMTISLAGITNGRRELHSYGEITNIAAEVKKKAKNQERSCLVFDERTG